MSQSCGTCKWWRGDRRIERNICRYPIPIWLHNRVTTGAVERLADYVHQSWGEDCATYEEVSND